VLSVMYVCEGVFCVLSVRYVSEGVFCVLSVRYMFEGGTSFGYMNGVYSLLCVTRII